MRWSSRPPAEDRDEEREREREREREGERDGHTLEGTSKHKQEGTHSILVGTRNTNQRPFMNPPSPTGKEATKHRKRQMHDTKEKGAGRTRGGGGQCSDQKRPQMKNTHTRKERTQAKKLKKGAHT